MSSGQPLLLQVADPSEHLPWIMYPTQGPVLLLAPPDAQLPQMLLALKEALDAKTLRTGSVIIGLSGSQAYPMSINLNQLDPNVPESLRYLIEEFVPIPAEDLVADVAGVKDNQKRDLDCLAVASRTEYLTHLIVALESLGFYTEIIIPIDLLISQAILNSRHLAPQGRFLCAHIHNSKQKSSSFLHLIEWSGQRPIRWIRLFNDHTILRNILAEDIAGPIPPVLIALNPAAEIIETVSQLNIAVEIVDPQAEVLLRLGAGKIAAHAEQGIRPLLNLRRDNLADPDRLLKVRKQAYLFAISICILFLASCAYWSVKANIINQVNRRLQLEQTQTFGTLFPGKSIPSGVRSRLESEYRKLKAQAGPQAGKLNESNALDAFIGVLSRFPAGANLRINELRVDSGKILIDGAGKTHSDADLLATNLRTGGLLMVEPPRTELTSQNGVAFTLSANISAAPQPETGGLPRKTVP